MAEDMTQAAPYPTALKELVTSLRYKPGWYFTLNDIDRGQGSRGLTLIINIHTPDSYRPEQHISVNHYMIVPAASYDERSWRRWLFDQILLVERHEAMEFFRLMVPVEHASPVCACGINAAGQPYTDPICRGGGEERPYAPSHGPGNDPYLIREVGTDEDRRMSFRGELNDA